MAADSRATIDHDQHYHCDKTYQVGKLLVGVAGEDAGCLAFVEYFRSGCADPDEYDFGESAALVLCPKRGILLFPGCGWPDPVREEFYAIGSGGPVALGAMTMGASAVEAVEAACKWNVNCGLPVVSLSLKKRMVRRKD